MQPVVKALSIAAVVVALAGCSSAAAKPAPTPEVVTQEVTITETHTATVTDTVTQTVTNSGPVVVKVPAVCRDAINGLDAAVAAETALLGAFLDSTDPTEAEIDAFLALDADGMYADAAACLAADGEGSL